MYYKIDEIKAIPIQDVCSHYGIVLKAKGENWWGRLRENDRTPSFSINSSKNIWRDWGISKGGDVISLVSEIEGVDQGKAILILGERFGIEQEYTTEKVSVFPTFNQFKSIGIFSKRAIQNLDINLEKQSIEEIEKLEEKFEISMQELANVDIEAYHRILDYKALPILYEYRKNTIDAFIKYINCDNYKDLLVYELIFNEFQDELNEKVDIYNKARLDGINLDELKFDISNMNDINFSDEDISKLKQDIKNLERISDKLNLNDEINYLINVKENVVKIYEGLKKNGNYFLNSVEYEVMDNSQQLREDKFFYKTKKRLVGDENMVYEKNIKSSNEDKVKELSEKLEDGIKDLFESDKYKNFLKVMSKFHNYSFRNSILIMMQKPEATYVAGFNKWNTFKRKVNKGEKGIKIFAPSPIKKKVQQYKKDEKGNFIYVDGKKVIEEVEQIIPKYKITYVFDISQTSGEPLPSLTEELKGSVNDYSNFKKALENSTSFNVAYGSIKGEAKGYCTPALKRIMVKENMSEVQTIKTLLHEMAHAELHTIKDGKSRETKEVEAESIAFIVSNYYGIDTSDYSFGYLAGWSSDKELGELKKSLDTIQKTAASLIDKIDINYKELFKDKEIKIDHDNKDIKEIISEASKKAEDHNNKLENKESKERSYEI